MRVGEAAHPGPDSARGLDEAWKRKLRDDVKELAARVQGGFRRATREEVVALERMYGDLNTCVGIANALAPEEEEEDSANLPAVLH